MALDSALKQALFDATEKAGQPPEVAKRLVAWLEAQSTGESSESLDLSFYQNVMATVVLPEVENAD